MPNNSIQRPEHKININGFPFIVQNVVPYINGDQSQKQRKK